MTDHHTQTHDPVHISNLEDKTMTARTETNMYRAIAALKDLEKATTDDERLAAAKALESAACQLRRELKKVTG